MAWIARILSRLLARWANYANVRARQDAEADLKAEQAAGKQKDSRIKLLEAEVEFLAQWRDSELAVLEKKASIERAAKVLSKEMSELE